MKRHAIFLSKNSFDEILYTLKWELKTPATKSQLLLFMEASYSLMADNFDFAKTNKDRAHLLDAWADEVVWFLTERCAEGADYMAPARKLENACKEWSTFTDFDITDVLAEALDREAKRNKVK